ncbi:MAG: hypothetical protein CLLPBCKN_006851 [Chroococcidiopsis cubana SAG 39.79]|nr:hypothetical protein [Chroococcidiopsis cubana SAG 39.79]
MNQVNIWLFLLFCLVYNCAALFAWNRPRVKVIENTSNKLLFHLRHFPAWVVGVSFSGVGLIGLVGSIRMAEFASLCINGFFVFLSLLIMAISPLITCRFDKERDRMTIKRQSWFSKKILKHSINDILNVKLEHSSTDKASFYRVTFTLSSSKNVPLTRSYSSDFEEEQYIANLIKNFLNLNM